MKKFSIAELARITGAGLVNKIGFFTAVSTDSRTIKAGDCFFALPGENFNGHDYVNDAFTKGAVCAVVSKEIQASQFPGRTILKVKDTAKALGDFAREYRRQCSFKVVAITGSVGKTTVRQIAYHVLSQRFRCHQSPRNFNNTIGLPLTLLAADPEHEIVIAELGSNHPGEIAYLTRIAAPDVAVVTNVYPVHLEGFGDLSTVRQEKLSISEGLQPDGVFIINNALKPATTSGVYRMVTFGESNDCDYQVQNTSSDALGSCFTIDGAQLYLPLVGPGNVENALAAWAICSQFGVTIEDFTEALKTLSAVPMRAELLQIGTLTVINDCYNANPASMKNALDILADLGRGQKRRLVFICGDMAELGQHSHRLHAELGASIAQTKVQLLLAVGKFARITAETARATACYNPGRHDSQALQIECFDNTLSACNNLHEFIKDYDIILVKGSRVARLEMAVEKLRELYKQKQQAQDS